MKKELFTAAARVRGRAGFEEEGAELFTAAAGEGEEQDDDEMAFEGQNAVARCGRDPINVSGVWNSCVQDRLGAVRFGVTYHSGFGRSPTDSRKNDTRKSKRSPKWKERVLAPATLRRPHRANAAASLLVL